MRLTALERNAMLDARSSQYASGYIRLYSGVRPTDGDTALSGNTLLATLRFGASPFTAVASGGSLTASAITQDSDAAASGTCTFARCFKSDGTTVIGDLGVATSGAEITVATTTIVQHAIVQATSATLSIPVGS